MLGGSAMQVDNFQSVINDITLLNSLGIRLVIVHGVRPQIQQLLDEHGHQSQFHNDQRITDEISLNYLLQAVGAVQIQLQAKLSMGLENSPMQGASIRTVISNAVTPQPIGVKDGVDHCLAGRVPKIDAQGLKMKLDLGGIPVISPIGYSVTGEVFNLFAEEVAIAINADKLIGFCSKTGVLDDQQSLISELLLHQADRQIQQI